MTCGKSACIPAPGRHELSMGTGRFDPAVPQHDDLVGVDNAGELVRDHQDGDIGFVTEALQRNSKRFLGFRI